MNQGAHKFAYLRLGSLMTWKKFQRRAGGRNWNEAMAEGFRRLIRGGRGFCGDVVTWHRGDHLGARLQPERERLERVRENIEGEAPADENADKAQHVGEICGLPPEPVTESASTASESNPVNLELRYFGPGGCWEGYYPKGQLLSVVGFDIVNDGRDQEDLNHDMVVVWLALAEFFAAWAGKTVGGRAS